MTALTCSRRRSGKLAPASLRWGYDGANLLSPALGQARAGFVALEKPGAGAPGRRSCCCSPSGFGGLLPGARRVRRNRRPCCCSSSGFGGLLPHARRVARNPEPRCVGTPRRYPRRPPLSAPPRPTPAPRKCGRAGVGPSAHAHLGAAYFRAGKHQPARKLRHVLTCVRSRSASRPGPLFGRRRGAIGRGGCWPGLSARALVAGVSARPSVRGSPVRAPVSAGLGLCGSVRSAPRGPGAALRGFALVGSLLARLRGSCGAGRGARSGALSASCSVAGLRSWRSGLSRAGSAAEAAVPFFACGAERQPRGAPGPRSCCCSFSGFGLRLLPGARRVRRRATWSYDGANSLSPALEQARAGFVALGL